MPVLIEWVVGLFALSPSACSHALTARSGGVLLSFELQKTSLTLKGFSSLSCKTECVIVVLNKEKLCFFSFNLPFTVNYYRVLFCLSSGYVRKIPGLEHRLQVL